MDDKLFGVDIFDLSVLEDDGLWIGGIGVICQLYIFVDLCQLGYCVLWVVEMEVFQYDMIVVVEI